MKRKVLVMAMLIISIMLVTACKKTDNTEEITLEQYIDASPTMQQSLEEANGSKDLTISVRGNDVIYDYDFSKTDGFTKEMAEDQQAVDTLMSSMDNDASTYESIAQYFEATTGIDKVRVIVSYKYGDKTLISQTYDSTPDD